MLQIRQATTADIGLIRRLTLQIWPTAYGKILSQEQLDYMLELMYAPATLQNQMETGNNFIIVQTEEIPVGFAAYYNKGNNIWKLDKIYILPNQQGKGTGKFVINYIIEKIINENAAALQLQVNRANPAQYFYQKLGFEIIETADFDVGNGFFMNDYIMEKKL